MTSSSSWAIVGVAVLITAAASSEPSGEAPALPMTYGQVWFRTDGHGGFGGGRLKGDLTLTNEGLLFASPKREVSIDWSSISMIGLGKMRGDVDTDWVVLAVGADGRHQHVAFRDGTRLGYGERTPRLYETIHGALRSLRRAHFEAPEGFEPYTALDRQFALPIPEGWEVRHLELVEVDGFASQGLFVVRWPPEGPALDLAGEAAAVTAGGGTVWAVVREESPGGAACETLGRGAGERIREAILRSPFVSGDGAVELGPGEPVIVDDCHGLRFGLDPGAGGRTEREVWAVSDGRTLYLLGVAADRERFAEEGERFGVAMGRVRFSPARAPAG